MQAYSLLWPRQVLFGWGRCQELGTLVADCGRRALLLTGSRTLRASGSLASLEETLRSAGLEILAADAPSREPTVADVDTLTAHWRSVARPGDVVVAIGGGSTIDLGKAAAAMVPNCHIPTVRAALEGVGTGARLTESPLPFVAVPTTAGTGSEATKNAVISGDHPPFKKSLRSDAMMPARVLIDPELSITVSPTTTAHTGLDAIVQLVESYVTRKTHSVVRALAVEGLRLALPALPVACREGANRQAREAMSHAAFLSGICLANSGLGLAHGVAAALGIHAGVPHGLACAVMLIPTLRYNLPVCTADFARLARDVLGCTSTNDVDAAQVWIEALEQLTRELQIPCRLRELGVTAVQIPDLVSASQGNSLSGNPRDIAPRDLEALLETLW